MSQISGLKYYILREGEGAGVNRKIKDAAQVLENSPLRSHFLKLGYYEGSREEWESLTKLTAGDMDGDGDLDRKDRKIIADLNKAA